MADFSNKKARKSNFSPEEVETLVSTVGKHYNILYGEFAKRAVNKHARHRVWLDVTKRVNRVSIERRTLQEVKNKWKKCQHLYREQDQSGLTEDFVLPNVWEPLTTVKDSMPLEQRLSNKTPTEQEAVLQSQPLSPTKLKVTRQTAKPAPTLQKPPTPELPNEEVCLRWNSHHSNMQNAFPNLLMREQYVDATLVAEGQTLKCHRLILSSCSPYFEEVLSGISPFQHPVLFMKDIPFWILKSLCDFMYAGEVHIFQNRLEELLTVAETLKIKGLAGKQEGGNEETKAPEPVKTVKEDKKEEVREKKKQQQSPAKEAEMQATKPKFVRSTHNSKRAAELAQREVAKKDEVLDPLDLLQPVYEELTTESKQTNVSLRFKETRSLPTRKSLPKKLKKRKLSDEREESPPMFVSRKGTRSRPNVKIPKYYHTHYERAPKLEDALESTIVREPHTDEATDPLMQVEEIKAEPLDLDDDVIEIEDNVVGYTDQEMPLQDEEIFGSYDTPIFNLRNNKNDITKESEENVFKKINLMSQPIIMNVHSVQDKSSDTLKIVDVAKIKAPTVALESKCGDSLDPDSQKATCDPLHVADEGLEQNTDSVTITIVQTNVSEESSKPEDDPVETSGITIANVESIADIENPEKPANSENVVLEKPVEISSAASVGATNDNSSAVPENTAEIVSVPEEAIAITNDETSADVITGETAREDGASSEPASNLEKVENRPETDNQTENVTEEIEQMTRDACGLECQENINALGFHIAKVASEQFTMDSDGRYTQNEECTSESPPERLPGAVVNNLETIAESQSALDVNNALSDESEILAKSLEALLEK